MEHPVIGPDRQLPAGESPHRRSKWVRIVLPLVLLLIAAIVLLEIWRHHKAAEQSAAAAKSGAAPIVITTVAATKGNIGVYLDSIGTVTPVYSNSITSEVNGLVQAVHYQEGQIVHKGDPLIDIDARPYRATLLQAQGALERDENVLAEARMDLDRYQDAWSRNAIAQQQLADQAKLVLQDQGTVKNDQGTVQYDQVQVDFCHITAPIDGRVGLRLVDPGNVVQASTATPLVVITQLEPITVVFTISEDNLDAVTAALRNHQKLTVDAFNRTALTKIATGTLLTIDNQIDTTTGTVKGRAVFANKDDALFPNQFVNTRLLVNTLKNVTLVPASTIQQNGQTSFVYVIQNNVAHSRTVKVGVTDNGVTQVDGVNPGDVLANSSFDRLQDNSKVTITNQSSSSSSTGNNDSEQNGGDGTGSSTP